MFDFIASVEPIVDCNFTCLNYNDRYYIPSDVLPPLPISVKWYLTGTDWTVLGSDRRSDRKSAWKLIGSDRQPDAATIHFETTQLTIICSG